MSALIDTWRSILNKFGISINAGFKAVITTIINTKPIKEPSCCNTFPS